MLAEYGCTCRRGCYQYLINEKFFSSEIKSFNAFAIAVAFTRNAKLFDETQLVFFCIVNSIKEQLLNP
jgi:hypothetical protein